MRSIIPGVNFPKLDACWLSAPAERSAAFLPAFARVSVAVQTALRERLPAEYFANPESFRDVKTAYPLLVYQTTRPFHGRKRTELTYDVLNPNLIASLLRRAKPNLIELLAQVEARLRAEDLQELADRYTPKRTTEIIKCITRLSKCRRCLYMLIRGESVLVDALVQLSGLGSLPDKEQARRMTLLGKKWNLQLRRFYPGRNFTGLAAAVLDAATEALRSFEQVRSGSDLSMTFDGPGGVGFRPGTEQTRQG